MRIAVTGLGVVFPGGAGREAFLAALRRGAPLLRPSRLEPDLLAAEIEGSLKGLVRRKGLAALSRGALLAVAAIESLLDARPGLLPAMSPGDCGLVVGTAFGHVESKAEFHLSAAKDGVRLVSPILFPNTIINSLGGHAAILFGLAGINSTVTSGRRSGLEAVLLARTLLEARRARRAIVVGADEVSRSLLRGLRASGVAAPAGGGEPAAGGRGHVAPGEAGVALLLEPAEEARGAVLGRLLGHGERNAVGIELGRAAEEAMRQAVEEAQLSPADIGWLALGRSGLRRLDDAEAAAAAAVFGPAKPSGAPKDVFGETFGASGTLALAAAISSWGAAEPLGALPAVAPPGPVLLSAVEEVGATCLVVGPP